MDEKQLAALERLASVLGSNAAHAVDVYATWFIAAAVFWVVAGIAVLCAAYKLWHINTQNRELEIEHFFSGVLALVGVLMIGFNLPDLISPQAVAIHQLLRDIVPG